MAAIRGQTPARQKPRRLVLKGVNASTGELLIATHRPGSASGWAIWVKLTDLERIIRVGASRIKANRLRTSKH
jgi:hypothetical protein